MFLRQRQAKASGIQRLISWLRHIGARIPTEQSRFSFKRADRWIQQVGSEAHQGLANQKLEFIRYHHGQSPEIFRDIRRQGENYWEIAEFQGIPGIGPVAAHLFLGFIEDPHRFRRRSQFYKFCQLAVTSYRSAGQPVGPKRLDKRNARLNTQRKIIGGMWALWKNGQPYTPNQF